MIAALGYWVPQMSPFDFFLLLLWLLHVGVIRGKWSLLLPFVRAGSLGSVFAFAQLTL